METHKEKKIIKHTKTYSNTLKERLKNNENEQKISIQKLYTYSLRYTNRYICLHVKTQIGIRLHTYTFKN